jgi:succinyl-CoA synthetase alpha subunit
MSILIDADHPRRRAGLHGRQGDLPRQGDDRVRHERRGRRDPGKGGAKHLDRPVFDTVSEAVRQSGATASLVFVPAAFCADSIMEAAAAGIRLVCAITDGIRRRT